MVQCNYDALSWWWWWWWWWGCRCGWSGSARLIYIVAILSNVLCSVFFHLFPYFKSYLKTFILAYHSLFWLLVVLLGLAAIPGVPKWQSKFHEQMLSKSYWTGHLLQSAGHTTTTQLAQHKEIRAAFNFTFSDTIWPLSLSSGFGKEVYPWSKSLA